MMYIVSVATGSFLAGFLTGSIVIFCLFGHVIDKFHENKYKRWKHRVYNYK